MGRHGGYAAIRRCPINNETVPSAPRELSLAPMRSYAIREMEPRDAYRLFISVVVPRPIAWVSTVGSTAIPNLAPFSFYNAIGGPMPMVMFSPAQRDGRAKDTLRNIKETGDFVLNVVDEQLASAMVSTGSEWAYDVNEFSVAGLDPAASTDVRPPRVAQARVAMEAQMTQLVPIEGTTYTMVIGRVVRVHVREHLLRSNGTVDPTLLQPVARLGGIEYGTLGDVFQMPIPPVPGEG